MWKAFEEVNGLAAIPAVWRKHLGERYPVVAGAFMRRHEQPATGVFCKKCYCMHRVVPRRDRYLGICDCEYQCDDIELTAEDLEVWEVNQQRLGRAVVSALGCDSADVDLRMKGTRQVGAFGAERLPVVLSVVHERAQMRQVALELAARLRSGFALLCPTGQFVDANVQEVLTAARAGFVDLDSHVSLLPSGALEARKTAGELFSGLLRERQEPMGDESARGLFALVKQLDSENPVRKAPIIQVFRLYCVDGLSRAEVARRCGCVESLVTLRLHAIEKKLGRKPSELRLISSQFERIEDSLSDSRAREIYRVGAAEIEGEEDE
jgi:hypothetical protein